MMNKKKLIINAKKKKKKERGKEQKEMHFQLILDTGLTV